MGRITRLCTFVKSFQEASIEHDLKGPISSCHAFQLCACLSSALLLDGLAVCDLESCIQVVYKKNYHINVI